MLEKPESHLCAPAQQSESGRGYLSLIITVLLLGAAALIAIQAVPVYVDNFELGQTAQDLAQQAAVNHITIDAVTPGITARAADLNLPVAFQDVNASVDGGMVRVRIHYTVPIDLKIYTWSMHLSVSASAPRLVY
ncbi:MAG: hypothetical protein ACRD10_09305 [Terriglobia bacterium]